MVDYTFDDDGRLSTVTSGGATTTYGYDVAANLTSTTLPASNGYVESRTYDPAGRLTEVKNAKGQDILSQFTYTLDEVGNPTRVVTPLETISYQYDELDRLTKVCFAPVCPELPVEPFIKYEYDNVGNRTTETRLTGTTTYAYNAADQLISTTGLGGTVNYQYDPNGNQTAAGTRTFTYDLADRMKSATVGSTTITYSYDGEGKRLGASSGAQPADTTKYLWDRNASLPLLVRESDGADALRRRYTYGADLISMRSGGSDFYYHHDALGSVANLTSSAGTAQWSYRDEPFGSTRTELQNDPTAPPNLMRFTGELLDRETGLYHLRARQYDPVTGRLLQLDPVCQRTSQSRSASYVYVLNRPTVSVDPSGQIVTNNADTGHEVRDAISSNVDRTLRKLADLPGEIGVYECDFWFIYVGNTWWLCVEWCDILTGDYVETTCSPVSGELAPPFPEPPKLVPVIPSGLVTAGLNVRVQDEGTT